jgi:hypothetical protein
MFSSVDCSKKKKNVMPVRRIRISKDPFTIFDVTKPLHPALYESGIENDEGDTRIVWKKALKSL